MAEVMCGGVCNGEVEGLVLLERWSCSRGGTCGMHTGERDEMACLWSWLGSERLVIEIYRERDF